MMSGRGRAETKGATGAQVPIRYNTWKIKSNVSRTYKYTYKYTYNIKRVRGNTTLTFSDQNLTSHENSVILYL